VERSEREARPARIHLEDRAGADAQAEAGSAGEGAGAGPGRDRGARAAAEATRCLRSASAAAGRGSMRSSRAGARLLYVLSHGAGAGMRHPFLAAIAEALAEESVATFRYEFPYMQDDRKRPDPPAVLHGTVRAAVLAARESAPDLPLIAGGKSFGGRMTTQAQADAPLPGVRGIALLGFPLHPARAPWAIGATRSRNWLSPADGRHRVQIAGVKTLLLMAALLAACTTAPVTGRKQLNLVGDSTINQLGMQSYQQEVAKAKTDTNPA